MVTGDSQEEVLIFRDRQTDRQTHMHHNIYIIIIIIVVTVMIIKEDGVMRRTSWSEATVLR